MSFMAEIAVVTIKTHRSSTVSRPVSRISPLINYLQSPLLRYHALIALQKALSTGKRAVSEATTKDIIKQMRSALTDKSLAVQRAAAQVGFSDEINVFARPHVF